MTNIAIVLSLTAVVMLICILSGSISSRMGVPVLIIFIGIGMLFGSDGIFKLEFENFEFAEQICTVAMVFIIFYGGFGVKWSQAKNAAASSLVLSCLGTILTFALTAIFCSLVLGFSLHRALIVGAVLSSTDAASVFNILRSKNLNLKYNSASILEIESGSNDPWAYMLTVITLSIADGSTSAGSVVKLFFSQLVFGAVIGMVLALAARKLISRLHTSN